MKKVIKISKLVICIYISFSYNPEFVQKIKTIDNYHWHPKRKYCSFQPMNKLNDISGTK